MGFLDRFFGREIAQQLTPSREYDYNAFLNEALAELKAINQRAMEEHGFGSYDRWDVNQEEGILRFSDEAGVVRMSAPVVLAGTYSSVSNSWMWGWANRSLLPHLTAPLQEVRAYGELHSHPDLTEPTSAMSEDEAWAMAAVALKILGGNGVYRGPSGKGYTFMLMKEIISEQSK